MIYFAYGMNMPSYTMSDMFGDMVKPIGSAVLPDHKLVFRCFADVIESPGDKVLGVAWQINDRALGYLDSREGYPTLYGRKQELIVVEGVEATAWVYQMAADRHSLYASKPDSHYLSIMKAGRQEFGHPIDDLELVMP